MNGAYKLLIGLVRLDPNEFFTTIDSRTRVAPLKLSTTTAKTQIRSKFFTNRVCSDFNKLLRTNVFPKKYTFLGEDRIRLSNYLQFDCIRLTLHVLVHVQ
ncbi:hypothetical protein Y032_0006g3052 [Ancylostoma ceylanicum]|uniref:Uncharacterized protein n=1 Tax=Ancylostoma ceylanicum TaxID=53326 RepID=A0A016VS70_9BILA|nr:hypothetical protein Y032_0006g3052 [Ancylostoma ceylanicum]